MPLARLGSAALLVTIVGAALAHRSYLYAAYLVLVGAIPVRPNERHRALGVALAWLAITLSVVGIVRVPFGARVTAVYLPACAVLVVRLLALRMSRVRSWASGKPPA